MQTILTSRTSSWHTLSPGGGGDQRQAAHLCLPERQLAQLPLAPTDDAEQQFTQVPEQGVRRRSGSQGDQRQLPEKCSAEHRLRGGGGCAWGRGGAPCWASRSTPWLLSALTEAVVLRGFFPSAMLLAGTCRGPRPARCTLPAASARCASASRRPLGPS